MDRRILKDNAKKVMNKNHMMCVLITFLSMLSTAGISSGFSFNLNLDLDATADQGSYSSGTFGIDEYSEAFLPFLLMCIVVLVIATVSSILLKTFVFEQLHVGGTRYFLKFRKNNPVDINELIASYKDKTYLNVAKTVFTRDISIFLWSFVFLIPGIIKSYEYAAVNFILSVRPDIDRKKALELSSAIMDGHKFDYFILNLSFYGWSILSLFTCMLLSIFYVNPYMMLTRIEFFSAIRDEAIANGKITPNDIPDYCEFIAEVPFTPYATQPGVTEVGATEVGEARPDETENN